MPSLPASTTPAEETLATLAFELPKRSAQPRVEGGASARAARSGPPSTRSRSSAEGTSTSVAGVAASGRNTSTSAASDSTR